MASRMFEESAYFLQVDEHDTGSRSGSCCRKLLFVGRVLLHLGCAAYCLYLIWLVAYLKDSPYYWFLSLIPFVFNLMVPLMVILKLNTAGFVESLENNIPGFEQIANRVIASQALHKKFLLAPSASVVLTLMTCFTMLTRLAYYHRQSDEFIGPQFIILSLKGSIILISLDFYLQREGKLEILYDYKDALTRMLLDFVDIFDMIELLSANECFGVGSFVSEESSMERAIQAFCTMSFIVVWIALDIIPLEDKDEPEDHHSAERSPVSPMEKLYSGITLFSGLYQNLPFFVIRIVVWAQYKLYSLGFLVKNFLVIVLFFAICVKIVKGGYGFFVTYTKHGPRSMDRLVDPVHGLSVDSIHGPPHGPGPLTT